MIRDCEFRQFGKLLMCHELASVLRVADFEISVTMRAPNTENISGLRNFAVSAAKFERPVADIGGFIRRAEPEKRAKLKDPAESPVYDEISTIAERSTAADSQARAYWFNLLFSGVLIVLLGFGFLLIFPMVT
jgi:hypothetical protein